MGERRLEPADRGAREDAAARWRRLLVEPRRPLAIANRPHAYRYTVATVCIGAFMGQLDASIVTVALPSLQRSFHVGLGAVTWVALSYLLVLVALVAVVGRVADSAGRKLLYVYGFVIFIVGSALCAAAPNLGSLVGFRVLQATGAAMLQANSVAILALAVPDRVLGRAIGVQGAAQALGLALGPSLGGLLLLAGGWRWLFLVNVPAGMVGVIAGVVFIPRSRHLQPRAPKDWPGLALFMPAMGALLLTISLGDRYGWTSPGILACALAALVLGAAFVRRERRAESPLIDLALFSRATFSAGVTSGLLSYLVLFGALFVVPYYLERGLGVGAGRAGAELTVLPLALGIVAPVAGRLSDRIGPRRLTVGGMVLTAAAFAFLSLSPPGDAGLLLGLALAGAGIGAFTPPNNAAIMGSVRKEQSGLASGVLNTTRGAGTALGLALAGLVFSLAGGGASGPHAARAGFAGTAGLLAGVALLAALVAALRGPVAPRSGSTEG